MSFHDCTNITGEDRLKVLSRIHIKAGTLRFLMDVHEYDFTDAAEILLFQSGISTLKDLSKTSGAFALRIESLLLDKSVSCFKLNGAEYAFIKKNNHGWEGVIWNTYYREMGTYSHCMGIVSTEYYDDKGLLHLEESSKSGYTKRVSYSYFKDGTGALKLKVASEKRNDVWHELERKRYYSKCMPGGVKIWGSNKDSVIAYIPAERHKVPMFKRQYIGTHCDAKNICNGRETMTPLTGFRFSRIAVQQVGYPTYRSELTQLTPNRGISYHQESSKALIYFKIGNLVMLATPDHEGKFGDYLGPDFWTLKNYRPVK